MIYAQKIIYAQVFLFLVILMVLVCSIPFYYSSKEITQIQVSEKTVKYHEGDAKYLVFSESGDVYQVTDTFMLMHFTASNVYGELKEGKNYTIITYGWRVPILSMYKNIVEVN